MLALVLAAAITRMDLQQWVDDQPQVRAYEMQKATAGLRPPPDDAFRQPPRLPRQAACMARTRAISASVMLFKALDEPRIILSEPDLKAKNDGVSTLVLNDDGKKVLSERAEQYEREAGRYEPACLG